MDGFSKSKNDKKIANLKNIFIFGVYKDKTVVFQGQLISFEKNVLLATYRIDIFEPLIKGLWNMTSNSLKTIMIYFMTLFFCGRLMSA